MSFMDQDTCAQIVTAFTQPVIVYPGTAEERTFDAIFDNWHQAYGDDLQLSGVYPELYCLQRDVVGVVQDDPVTVDGTAYRIRDVQEDGIGIIKLELKIA